MNETPHDASSTDGHASRSEESSSNASSGASKVWLNGRLLDRDEAKISLFDAGLQHGVGLFETMLGVNGRVYRLEQHLERLEHSARELRLTESIQISPLAEAVGQTLDASGLDRARIRLTMTGGDLNLLQSQRQGPVTPTVFIVAQPATAYPDEFFERGARVVVADGRLNPFERTAGHKTLNYWFRLQALQDAASKNAAESIWLSVSNHIMSGSVSNLFIVKDGVLFTPIARGEEAPGALPSPVLPGITRAAVLQFAENRDIEVRRRMLDISNLLEADEVFLTNSSWGVLPVTGVEAREIGDGGVGPVAKAMREIWFNDQVS